MAEVRLFDAIEKLRYENSQYHTANFVEQEKQTDKAETLNKTVGLLLSEFRKSREDAKGDAEERRRDAQGSGGATPSSPERVEPPELEEDAFGLKGVLQVVAGIGVAIAGFAAGFAKGFLLTAKLIFKAITPNFLVKPFVGLAKNINGRFLSIVKMVKDFVKAATLAFSIRFPQITNAILGFGEKIGKITKSFSTGFTKTVGQFGRIVDNLKNAFTAGTNGVRGVARAANGTFRSLNVIEKFANTWGKVTGQIANSTKALGSMFSDKLLKPVKGFINSVRGIGQSTSLFGKSLRVLFTAFKTIGRFIAFPITIVMSIIDAFKGMMAGAERQTGFFNKLVGGFVGIFTGLVKGLIGMPLDLLKDGISWIAGKLGFENFSKVLDSFSFGEMITNIGNKITDGFVQFFDSILYTITNVGDALFKPFKDGFSLGAILEMLTNLPGVLYGTFFDLVKGGISSLLGIFGFDEASKALDSFSFIKEINKLIDLIGTLPGMLIDWVVDKLGSIDFGAALEAVGDFGASVMNQLKSLVKNILPDPDSLLANVIPNALYEWTDTPVPPPAPKKVATETTEVEGGTATTNAPIDIEAAKAQLAADQANLESVMKDYYDGNADDMDKSEAELWVQHSQMMLDEQLERMKKLEKVKVESPETTPQTARGQEVSEMSKENAQAKGSANVAIVNAPQSSNVTNNTQSTAALIDQNLPTVDYNDRSFGFAAMA